MSQPKKSILGKVDGRAVIQSPTTAATSISLTYGIITNTDSSTITINLQIERANVAYYVIPKYLSLQQGESLELPDGRVLQPSDKLILLTSGSVDYLFSFGENF